MPGMLEGLQTTLCEQQSCNYLGKKRKPAIDVKSQQGGGGGRSQLNI